MSKDAKQDQPELGSAAERRADYVRALEDELAQVERQGKADRVKAVKAELARVQGAPQKRAAAPKSDAKG